ncbi:TonB-dependent receptor [Litorivivens sp.]|uniref:TonB-dependent receptor n=2 Tax=Litorivivens sp. TaxID=2020868 RepID=UPI00356820C4
MRYGKITWTKCASLAAALTASAAYAQDGTNTNNTREVKTSALEEVIVTATRREESAQDVAISITVFSDEQIANANMTNAADLATYTPSLSTNTRFGNENTSFSLRGFTQSLRTAASVATYFAEVVAPRGQTSQTSGDGAGPGYFYDLQNVQVLKGPQGTLFGRNTTGGAVLLVPNKPSDEFEGYIELSDGDMGISRLQGVVNFPVADNFKIRFGVDKNERDGHLNNVANIGAEALGNTDYTALRLSVVWDITDDLENYTIFNVVDSESKGYTSRLFTCNDNADPSVNTFYALTGPACAQQLERQEAMGQRGWYDLVSTIATPITTIQEKRVINTTTWNLSDTVTLKNILAYSHLETENGSDIFGTQFTETAAGLTALGGIFPAPLPGADPRREFAVGVSVPSPDIPVTSQVGWIEEIQLQGISFDGRLIWQGGAYYESSKPDGFSGNTSAGLISCDLTTIESADPNDYNCFDITNGTLGSVLDQEYKTEFLNKAIYAQASYDLLQTLSITAGLRYTWDETRGFGIKRRHTFTGENRNPDPIVSISTPEQESNAPTGMIEVSYQPINDVMVYGKYIRGYRQGSVNLAADPGLDSHDYETVDTYEIGLKSRFGGWFPGRFNIAVFDNELTDMQLQYGYISATAGPTTTVANAGEAEIKGFEIEAMVQLYEGLTVNLSYSELDTKLVEAANIDPQKVNDAVTAASGDPFSGFIASQTATPIADKGDELPFAAEQAWVATLNYQLPIPAEWGVLSASMTYVHTGEQRAAASSASPFAILPSYDLINYNASWLSIMGSDFDLSVFATNVRDEEYLTYISGTYNTLSFESVQVGLPKMVGARLRYNFGN